MIGRTLSHYRIREELSRGGMGIVYRAVDLKLNREVALKVLPPELVADPERRRRFVQEAQAASALEHPHIAVIHEIDEADGVTFIAMELIRGEKLREALSQGRLTVSRALDLAVEVAEGLVRAHDKGIVHRDLKPANIMVTEDGHAKIIDFGLAKLVEPLAGGEGSALETATRGDTEPGKVLGTVGYMSPEQARGGRVDHRSDVFSLGIVLHEMLTGEPPFKGASSLDVLHAIVRDPAPPLGAAVPAEASGDLQRVLDKCLAKDPDERYQGMRDVVVDLRAARRRLESTSLARVGPVSSGPTQAVAASVPSGVAPVGAKQVGRKSRWLLAGGAALAAVVLGLALPRLLPRREPPSAAAESRSPAAASNRKMLVVLPFENLGPTEDAYFAAGITEEITSRLGTVQGLGVISRTSAVQYDRAGKTMRQIGQDLRVEFVLEGSVRWDRQPKGPGRVRITPQLIRVADDTHLWAERYDRVLDDVFAVQSEIAEAVVKQLGVTLLAGEKRALEARPTQNVEAYQAYLRGLDHANDPDSAKESFELAVRMFERAVTLDPTFTTASARLSVAHSALYHYGYDRSESRLSEAHEAATHSLKLQPDSPEGHRALGTYYYWGLKDYERALAELTRAAERLPNDAELLAMIGYVRRRQGHFDEAASYLKKALDLDPRDASIAANLAETLRNLRQYDEADRYSGLSITVAPDQSFAYVEKASTALAWKGATPEAREWLERIPKKDDPWYPFWRWWFSLLERDYEGALKWLAAAPLDTYEDQFLVWPKPLMAGLTYRHMKEPERARASFEAARLVLEGLVKQRPQDHRVRMALGFAYAGLGRKAEAIREGERAVQLYPVSKDALTGPDFVADLADIYAWAGEHDQALDRVESLLSIPSRLSVPMLRIDPRWDPLRGHPRFQKLVEGR